MTLATVLEMVTGNIFQAFEFGAYSINFDRFGEIRIQGYYDQMMEHILPASAKLQVINGEARKQRDADIWEVSIATGEREFHTIVFILTK